MSNDDKYDYDSYDDDYCSDNTYDGDSYDNHSDYSYHNSSLPAHNDSKLPKIA